MTQPMPETRRVHIPEITSSLKTLFVLRTIISLGLIGAGIAVLLIGSEMLLTSIGSGNDTILFEIAGSVKITASGFGAVVMATSVVPFIFAYKARPTLHLFPTNGGGFSLSSENADSLKDLSGNHESNVAFATTPDSKGVGLNPYDSDSTSKENNRGNTTNSFAVHEFKKAA